MKITYNKNPLLTTIELDEHEKKELWYKIKVKELEEALSSASIYLDPANASWTMKPNYRHPQLTTETLIEMVRKDYLDMDYVLGDEKERSKLDQRVDELLEWYVQELQSDHCGDCTCVPASCSKCHAEALLGINTIPGLGKHSAYKINGAFGKDGARTLDEAIIALGDYDPKPPADPQELERWGKVGGFMKHVPRWKSEAEAACVWLKNYRDTHFGDAS